jgi:chorismate mutase
METMSFNHIWNKIKTRSEKLMIAGPCSAESAEQLLVSAKALIGSVHLMRAGVWKPRTRPGSFEGHGEVALGWLADLKKSMGLRFCVEVANRAQVKLALDAEADAIWIGARTTAGPFIVQEIAEAILEFNRTDILVMVKNPQAPDLSLWLGAIERLETVGCKNIVAIHRGFTSYHSKSYRNSPYWKIVFELRAKRPDLIVISDPSHVAGLAELVPEIVYKAVEMDLDGLMIEVHPDPENALSDKAQQLTPKEFHFLKNDSEVEGARVSN